MRIVTEWPPNIEEIKKAFNLSGHKPAFTYGNILYNPYGSKLPRHFIKHEETHERQQGNDPAGWWARYLIDPKFRLDQELEAYKIQFRIYKQENKGYMPWLRKIVGDLSSPMYGSIISFNEAFNILIAVK